MTFCFSACGDLPSPHPTYAACYEQSSSCNILAPNFNYDPHRKKFCQKFGQYAPFSCQRPNNPCESLHRSLRSLDEFSLPPMYRKGGFEPKFRCKLQKGLIDECCPQSKTNHFGSQEIPQLPQCYRHNPKPYGDVICGIRVNTKDLEPKSCPAEEIAPLEYDQELPFVVYPLWNSDCGKKKSVPKRSGVSKCIHPSSFRSLDTVSKLEYVNFFKLKSSEDLALYQSKLAVDHRRPRVCLSSDDSEGFNLDTSRPIVVNAKMLSWNQRGKRQVGSGSVSVCVPGPITIG